LLASVGFFLRDKIQEAKSVDALWSFILTGLNLSLKHVVPVFIFKELEEIQIVEVFWEISNIKLRHALLLGSGWRTFVSNLILSRCIFPVDH
jgi:hypothetical protein